MVISKTMYQIMEIIFNNFPKSSFCLLPLRSLSGHSSLHCPLSFPQNQQKNGQNATRFVIVSKKPIYVKDAHKISIFFELPHESGTLYNMLSHIIYNGLNMTKIESRPITGKNWQYRFFVDFEGNLKDSAVKNALRGIEAEADRMRILGNY